MAIEILMPRLSDTMEEGKILRWLKQVGDRVEVGDIIAEVETDKADMEMEALDAGVLVEIRVREGESAPVGAVIAILSEDGVSGVAVEPQPSTAAQPQVSSPLPLSAAQEREQAHAAEEGQPDSIERRATPKSMSALSSAPRQEGIAVRQTGKGAERKVREIRESRMRRDLAEAQPTPERVLASPLVRRMAEEQGIDLSQVRGSGPGGRIVKHDLEAYLSQVRREEQLSQPAERPETAVVPLRGAKEQFSRMRMTIAKRMAESMREIPHFYVTCEIDMSEVVRLRAALQASDRVSTEVTYTHFLIKAVALALERHPRLNASFVEDGREIKAEINIGLAVALEDGLIVPVLHQCEKLSLLEIAAQAHALVERARTGKPTSEDLSGGTFTISNMGMLPIDHFTAIINPPQGAILAVGAIKERPVVRDGQIRVAHTMMVTLSCDHRILDGVAGGRFLAELKQLLENPVGLLV
ncbi:MAG: 2-oxo acid dehydrogenase subunit E2 [Candidatus Binatia bacterium]|nr:2-oxo acid dehydrogenase subunit E2 [Candidatus Binatia bacterium]